MVESFLEFLKSLANRRNVRTLSLAELDQKAPPLGRRTQDRSLSIYPNVVNRCAGFAGVFGSGRVASTGLSERHQAVRDSTDDTLRRVRAYRDRAPLVRVCTIGGNPSCQQRPLCSPSINLPSLYQLNGMVIAFVT